MPNGRECHAADAPREDNHDRIDRLIRELTKHGWDSYDAEPLDPHVGPLAHLISDCLGNKWVGPTPDGGLCFEWDIPGGTYMVEVNYAPNLEPTRDA